MKTLTLKPQHETSAIGQLLALKSAITYHQTSIAPVLYQAEYFERKEYEKMNDANIEEIKKLKQYVIENESTFNQLLSGYNLSVAVFINKFILN